MDHITIDRLEKYIRTGDLDTVYGFRSMTWAQMTSVLREVEQKGRLSPVDQWMLTDYGIEKNGWQLYSYMQVGGIVSRSNPARLLETDAWMNPLVNAQQGGRFVAGGHILNIEPRLVLENAKWFSLDLWPQIRMTDDQTWDLDMFQAVLKVGVHNLELAAGQMHFKWGQGRHASMLFAGSQKPLQMIRLQNVEPTLLPGWFSFLGKGKFTLFFARMDDDQALPGSLLVGERIAFRVSPVFEFGLTQMIQVGGQGYPDVPWYENVSEVLGYRFNANETNFTNRNAMFDFRFRIPQWNNLNLYGEVFLEDCCNINFDKNIGNMLGIELPEVGRNRATTIGFEHIRTTFVYNRHFRYRSGFIYEGISLGHHIGADALGFYGFIMQDFANGFSHEFLGALEVRQVHDYSSRKNDIRTIVADYEVRERRLRGAYQVKLHFSKQWTASIQWGLEYIQGFDFALGNNKIFAAGRYQLEYSF
ncbi:MAG: hypothetical protein KDK51_08635 [Deltaproteobacteria bacterium]|nr:hypothetical protein [Deltaproteobacteria bacterium]